VLSAGTDPDDRVGPVALAALAELGIDRSDQTPTRVTAEMIEALTSSSRSSPTSGCRSCRAVRELTESTGLGQTLVSHHVAPLREQGLVTVIPRGRSNVYSLCCEALAGPVRLLPRWPPSPPRAQACCAP
jgi:DNA-binding transcriptional ArsR family regulator